MKFVRLKKIREDNDNTQQEIADILGVKRGTYASWESGTDTIPITKIYEYANHYSKSIDYILGLSNKNIDVTYNKDFNLEQISERLKLVRLESDLSQKRFSDSIGINQSTWWSYENGRTLIKTSSLIMLSKKYNYSIDWIFGRIK